MLKAADAHHLVQQVPHMGVVELVELAVQGLDMPLRARVRCGSLSSAARDVWLSVRKSDVLVFESDGENA